MEKRLKLKVGAGVAAAAAVAGGGAAIAADRLGSSNDSQAVVNDAAKQLGVTPSALTAALKKALENRIDAAVAAGQLTKAQGDELKQRIESGSLPLFFGPRGGPEGHFGHFGELDAAASYLGLTDTQLDSQLNSGKLMEVQTEAGPTIKTAGAPVASNNFMLSVRHQPPGLGQHTREVLLEIGYSEPEIEALAASGVVRLDGPVLLSGGRPS